MDFSRWRYLLLQRKSVLQLQLFNFATAATVFEELQHGEIPPIKERTIQLPNKLWVIFLRRVIRQTHLEIITHKNTRKPSRVAGMSPAPVCYETVRLGSLVECDSMNNSGNTSKFLALPAMLNLVQSSGCRDSGNAIALIWNLTKLNLFFRWKNCIRDIFLFCVRSYSEIRLNFGAPPAGFIPGVMPFK